MKVLLIFAFLVVFLLLVSGCSAPSPATTLISTTSIPSQSPTPTLVSKIVVPAQTVTQSLSPIPAITTVASAQTVTQSPTLVPSSGKMMVSFIDVGQGDSELIQSLSGKVMLIDAGPTATESQVVKYLRDRGISTIDVVVATHSHEDHIGGMSAVLNEFTVKQFIDGGYPHTTSTYENMLNLIDERNIPFRTVSNGDTIAFDPAITVQVLNPQKTFTNDINQNSVVLKMTYGKVSYLFTGDAESDAENYYAGAVGDINILKVAHHGFNTSSGANLLSLITPEVSVIEVGSVNSYKDSTSAALQRLQQAGSKVYRTDLDGTITITSDGSTYSVYTEKLSGTIPIPMATSTQYQITTQPVSASVEAIVCDCSSDRYNCADFSTQAAAQACYNNCVAQGKGDIHRLDGDNNSKACENNK